MSSFPLSTVMGYLPRAVVPPFAKDIVTIAATFGCLEIWTRIKAQSISEVSAFDNLASWVDYPSDCTCFISSLFCIQYAQLEGICSRHLVYCPISGKNDKKPRYNLSIKNWNRKYYAHPRECRCCLQTPHNRIKSSSGCTVDFDDLERPKSSPSAIDDQCTICSSFDREH